MFSGLDDTDAEVHRTHVEMLRAASPERRLALALSLTQTVLSMTRARIASSMPGASQEELGLRFVAELYGDDLAGEVRDFLATRSR